MNSQWLMIKQLDNQLKEWQVVNSKYGRPRFGWVRTLRVALSMTTEQLASRLGVKRGRIAQLENAEICDRVTLRALKDAAEAMECEFIYAIVPKKFSTLESIVKTRAEQVAQEKVSIVAHTMSLEAQSVNSTQLENQKNELAKDLVEHMNKKLWAQEYKTSPEFAKALAAALVKNKGNK